MRPILDELYRKALSNEDKQQEYYPNTQRVQLVHFRDHDYGVCEMPRKGVFFIDKTRLSNTEILPDEIKLINEQLNLFRVPAC